MGTILLAGKESHHHYNKATGPEQAHKQVLSDLISRRIKFTKNSGLSGTANGGTPDFRTSSGL